MNSDSSRKQIAETARFDDSFATHMIRDFFLVLVAVVIIELSVRFALVIYDFHNNQELVTRIAAERLASDIKSIMLNSGGPVAARTVYPILDRNHEELGLAIAIEPSEITVSSIEAAFDFTPRGLPAAWSEGEHYEVTVPATAERLASRNNDLTSELRGISADLGEFRHFLEEMAVLEEKMRGIAAQGQTLLQRLTYVEESDAVDGVESLAVTS